MEFPRHETPPTPAYVKQSFQTFHTPTPKRNANDMEESSIMPSSVVTPNSATRPEDTYATVVASNPPTKNRALNLNSHASSPQDRQSSSANNTDIEVDHMYLTESTAFLELEQTPNSHSNALMDLRSVVATLASTQAQMSKDISTMNANFNLRFQHMAHKMEDMTTRMEDMMEALSNLKHSPTRSGSKVHKGNAAVMDITHHNIQTYS